MYAIGADALRQIRIGRYQQEKPARARYRCETPCDASPLGSAKMAINHAGSAWQATRNRLRIWRSRGIGEEKQARNSGRPGSAVEPGGARG